MAKLWNKNFILVLTSIFTASIAFYMLVPTLPVYLESNLNLPTDTIGFILSIYTLASLLTRPVFGFLLDQKGRKKIFVVSTSLFTVLFPLYAIIENQTLFYILRFMHGIAWAGVTASAATSAVDLIPSHQRASGLGYYSMAIPLAYAIGPAVGLQIIHFSTFAVLFVITFLLSLPAVFCSLRLKFPRYTPSNVRFNIRNLIEKTTLPIGIVSLLYNISYGGLSSYVALYASEITNAKASFFFIGMALSIAFARIFSGKAYRQLGAERTCNLSFISLTAGFLTLSLLHYSWGFYFSSLLIGLGYGVINPIFQTLINNIVPYNRRGAANSTLTTMADTGNGIGMILSGFLAVRIGFAHTFLSYAGLILLTIDLFIFYSMRRYHAYAASQNQKQ